MRAVNVLIKDDVRPLPDMSTLRGISLRFACIREQEGLGLFSLVAQVHIASETPDCRFAITN